MIEQLVFAALTKAWVTTMIATGLLFLALATAQVWNSAVYFQRLAAGNRNRRRTVADYRSPRLKIAPPAGPYAARG